MDLSALTVESTRTAIAERTLNPVALVEEFYKKIEADDPQIGAYLTLAKDRALTKALAVQALADKGDALPPLAGVPIAIKDVMTIKGVQATAGSKILKGWIAPYTATAVQRLEDAGAIILARRIATSLPWARQTRTPATSLFITRESFTGAGRFFGGKRSCGCGEPGGGALGSDTGGSIRQPAAFCGVVGLLPTYGRVSRYGLIAFASSLDHIGPLTKTVKDAAILLRYIAGRDELDSTSA